MSEYALGVRRRVFAAVTALGLAAGGALLAATGSGAARAQSALPVSLGIDVSQTTVPLPAPPTPPSGTPVQPVGAVEQVLVGVIKTTVSTVSGLLSGLLHAVAPPSTAKSWGAAGPATTLVLYDTTNSYGWLGELYGLAAGNLATHFGKVTAEPVGSYVSGQMNSFTSVVYLGSTYNEPVPTAFLTDVLSAGKPVIWAGDNIWQLSGVAGSPADNQFTAAYGWDPSTSWFDTTDTFTRVDYKGQVLTRSNLDQGGILAPHITDQSKVSVLASGECADASGASTACASIAQTPTGATTVPWAIRSGNLTYVGEIPFAYLSESDRYLAFADLLYAADAPTAPAKHQALVRLEDITPMSDPTEIRADVDYLASQGVPFSLAVVPVYTDPNGTYNNGSPQTLSLLQAPAVVSALRYAQSKGGTILEHGYTHQWSNVANPYNGVTADDFEFYRAQCSLTQNAPYTFEAPCQNTDWVISEGPVPNDGRLWAQSRALLGRTQMNLAGFFPNIWVTPHYSASAADYAGIGSLFGTRYERELFFGGQLGGTPDVNHVFGQFFPYLVHDAYGSTMIPEDLGNYEPEAINNHPPRLAADVLANARANLVGTQAVASFFFHPYYPIDQLQTIVSGIKAMGYTFVSPATVAAGG